MAPTVPFMSSREHERASDLRVPLLQACAPPPTPSPPPSPILSAEKHVYNSSSEMACLKNENDLMTGHAGTLHAAVSSSSPSRPLFNQKDLSSGNEREPKSHQRKMKKGASSLWRRISSLFSSGNSSNVISITSGRTRPSTSRRSKDESDLASAFLASSTFMGDPELKYPLWAECEITADVPFPTPAPSLTPSSTSSSLLDLNTIPPNLNRLYAPRIPTSACSLTHCTADLRALLDAGVKPIAPAPLTNRLSGILQGLSLSDTPSSHPYEHQTFLLEDDAKSISSIGTNNLSIADNLFLSSPFFVAPSRSSSVKTSFAVSSGVICGNASVEADGFCHLKRTFTLPSLPAPRSDHSSLDVNRFATPSPEPEMSKGLDLDPAITPDPSSEGDDEKIELISVHRVGRFTVVVEPGHERQASTPSLPRRNNQILDDFPPFSRFRTISSQ